MNHVTIGHFVCDENGHSKGGKPGDQTGKEGRFQAWYKTGSNGKGWQDVFRAKDKDVRKKIAENMIELVENPHVGYNQDARTTLDKEAKKVNYDFKKVDVRSEELHRFRSEAQGGRHPFQNRSFCGSC